ncbi:MAG TPA: hypothetical protein PKL31_15155 [Fulvivirga sp.]|nr:hypothetical protein [Fulvivirga sp.]
MKNINTILYFLFSVLIMASCSKEDNKANENIEIRSGFEDTQFSGYFTLDGVTVPISGAFVHVTKNSVFNDIIINLAPAGVSGSVAFPGHGWLQFRFNTAVKPGFVTATQLENAFTVASSEPIDPVLFEGLYIDADGNSWEIQQYGKVNNSTIEYTSADEYAFDFSFESDTFWERKYGDSFVETRQGDLFFSVGTSSSGGSSNSSNPLVGTWTYQQANCGSSLSIIQFVDDSHGSITIPDCNESGSCPTGSVTQFNYTTSGNQITFVYTGFNVCGQSTTPPKGGTISYSVSGNKLTLGSQTWTKR